MNNGTCNNNNEVMECNLEPKSLIQDWMLEISTIFPSCRITVLYYIISSVMQTASFICNLPFAAAKSRDYNDQSSVWAKTIGVVIC